MSNPWVIKYCPKRLEEISGNRSELIAQLSRKSPSQLPHLLLHGPPGSGKNTFVSTLLKKLYGPDFHTHVKLINASKDRGIASIRKLKLFAKTLDGKPHIIVFDEADKFTPDAQQALRRIMELGAKNVRFFFLCNRICKIIFPIQSRTEILYFAPFAHENALRILKKITREEKLVISDLQLQQIVHLTEGDIRRAITLLYSTALVHPSQPILDEDIIYASGDIPDPLWKKILLLNSVAETTTLAEELVSASYSFKLLMLKIQGYVLKESKCSDLQKAKFLSNLGVWEVDYLKGKNIEVLFPLLLLKFYIKILLVEEQEEQEEAET